MSVTVELTYDMSTALGVRRIEIDGARRVSEAIAAIRERFGEAGADFDALVRVAGVAVNGVLINHRRGMRTPLAPGDRLSFVKAAAGG